NPMRAERMCGLARFVSTLPISAAQTAATQWLERTLDDSVNRRLTLPQAFLGADGVLRLALNISNGLIVNPKIIARNIEEALPYRATGNLLMEAVAQAGDPRVFHEPTRHHSQLAAAQLKAGAQRNDLLDRLRADPAFASLHFDKILDPAAFVGRAPQQVQEFL